MEQPALFADAFRSDSTTQNQVVRHPHQRAVDGWTQLWKETRGEPWRWTPMDLRRVKDTLKFRCDGNVDEFLERARRLLADAPTTWLAQNASPSVLYAHWFALSVKVKKPTRDQHNLATLRATFEAL